MSSCIRTHHLRSRESEGAYGYQHQPQQPAVESQVVGPELVCRIKSSSTDSTAAHLYSTKTVLSLPRGEPLPQQVQDQKPNIILAADCVYFEPAFPLLLATLEDLLALNEEAVIFFCFKKRRRADMQFMKNARKKFLVEEIEDVEREKFSTEGLFLYTFKKK